MNGRALTLGFLCALSLQAAEEAPTGHFVSVGDHQLFALCTGAASGHTVVLLNGLGAGLPVWTAVQNGVEKSTRVCSYDRAGDGRSPKIDHLQTPEEAVEDLHRLLDTKQASGPYVLVGASLGGIYARAFASRYPDRIAAIVLVDPAHEEQFAHYAALSPQIAERYATQDGRFPREAFLRSACQLEPGRHLVRHLDVPLIVLEHKRLAGPPRTEFDRLAVDWHDLQVDLAARSKYSKLVAGGGGHMMAVDQPELVIDSIRQVLQQAKALEKAAHRR